MVLGAVRMAGKGPGYIALAFFEVVGALALAFTGHEVALLPYGGVMTAINVPVFGAGMLKARAEAKNHAR